MTVSSGDKLALRHEYGFTFKEIRDLDRAVDPSGKPQPEIDFSIPEWQEALRNHRQFRDGLQQEYFKSHNGEYATTQYLDRVVDQWYRKGRKRTPFDWLNEVYKVGNRSSQRQKDFQEAASKRRKRLNAHRNIAAMQHQALNTVHGGR